MPSCEEKAIFIKVNYIKNKLTNVKEETESVITLLQNCLIVFDRRVEECVKSDGKNFTSLYRKLNTDIEDFQEKLFYIQASVEIPANPQQVSKESSSTQETNLSTTDEVETQNQISTDQSLLEISLSNSTSLVHSTTYEPQSIDQNTKVKSVYSSKSISYASINDVEELTCDLSKLSTVVTNTNEADLYLNSFSETDEKASKKSDSQNFFQGSVESIKSHSHSSCYRSLSSSISGMCQLTGPDVQQNFERYISDVSSISEESPLHFSYHPSKNSFTSLVKSESLYRESLNLATKSPKRNILPLHISYPMTTTTTLTHVENPGNFWIQLDSVKTDVPQFPKEKFLNTVNPECVEEGDFFLAPAKSVPYYLRVKVLSDIRSDGTISVLFVDYGSKQIIPVQELRFLPVEAFDVPMQAINCYLVEISAPNNIWCFAAVRKLKELEFSGNSLETHVKTYSGDKYGVQLTATISMFGDEFPCDIGQSLCFEGFAIENKPSQEVEDCTSMPVLCDNTQTNLNQISCDSGVSVTSNRHSSPALPKQLCNSDFIDTAVATSPVVIDKNVPECEITSTKHVENDIGDLISFESIEDTTNDLEEATNGLEDDCLSHHINYIKCLKICTCECPLHLIIPLPSIKFVEENMVLVMLSHVVNPNEFYVNMAMESSMTLDDLLENMNIAYSSSEGVYSILLEDLKEGMYCAAYFDDGNWYRVKVISKNLKYDESLNVLVQYVDYGNKAWIKNTDLRTLTPEFSKPPTFAVKCSLAGVVPAQPTINQDGDPKVWNEQVITTFKDMIMFENCLTAQICDKGIILNEDPLQILLWDTRGKKDVLINEELVNTGLAEFNFSVLEELLNGEVNKKNDIEYLNQWDPMKEEYSNVQNSYGVNVDDFQVAVNGYKHNDEDYICKYFSLRGYCPRINCAFEHIELGEGGVTRDQEELYSFDSPPPLPAPGSCVLLQVCSVISPCHFYAQLPFGNRTVDELDSLINRGVSRVSLQNAEVHALFSALNNHYNNKPFDEKTTVALSYGSIVVAKRQHDQTWHRARIIDVHDVAGPAKVFYVDFGNEEWVERRDICQILPEFLHTPFQAIECSLNGVEPLGFEKGQTWSMYALSRFKALVSNAIMLAEISGSCNDVLQVSLRRTTETDHRTIKDHLIREGFAQEKTTPAQKKPQSKYVPG